MLTVARSAQILYLPANPACFCSSAPFSTRAMSCILRIPTSYQRSRLSTSISAANRQIFHFSSVHLDVMFSTESRAMVATNTTFMVLAILSVVLRFQVRRPKAFRLELDDYLVLAALVRMTYSCQLVSCSFSDFCAKVFLCRPRRHEHCWRFCCRLWNAVRVVERRKGYCFPQSP